MIKTSILKLIQNKLSRNVPSIMLEQTAFLSWFSNFLS